MNDSKRAIKIIEVLGKKYPGSKTALFYKNPFQLLVATILSAQCTDKKVNEITPGIFNKYKDVYGFSAAEEKELEENIYSSGFYKNKTKNIIASSKIIVRDFNGKVPDSMASLLKLPGVARKTANIVLSSGFQKIEGVAVDTHVKRLSTRFGFSSNSNPDKIEKDLISIFPKSYWLKLNHILVNHGRETCKARNPLCLKCAVGYLCKSEDKRR
ncbi:MAG: endonuclease III [Candidatus Kaelpia aquatica]|nr:endonuclease III [Candidatus Kaelpia aquatica]